MNLPELTQEFALRRELQANSVAQYEAAVACLGRFLGRQPTDQDLVDETVNRWLVSLESKLASATRKSRRNHLLALWRAAYRQGVVPAPPGEIRRIKSPPQVPRAWSVADVRRIRDEAKNLPQRAIFGLPLSVKPYARLRLASYSSSGIGRLAAMAQRCSFGQFIYLGTGTRANTSFYASNRRAVHHKKVGPGAPPPGPSTYHSNRDRGARHPMLRTSRSAPSIVGAGRPVNGGRVNRGRARMAAMPQQGPNVVWCDTCGRMIRGHARDIDRSKPVSDFFVECESCEGVWVEIPAGEYRVHGGLTYNGPCRILLQHGFVREHEFTITVPGKPAGQSP